MPWRQKAMKDVDSCDKPRGAAKQALIRGFLNGKTRPESCPDIVGRIHTPARQTGGTETSQYPQEKKATAIPKVVASEMGTAQTQDMFKSAGVVSWGLRGVLGEGCGPFRELQIQLIAERPGKAYHRR